MQREHSGHMDTILKHLGGLLERLPRLHFSRAPLNLYLYVGALVVTASLVFNVDLPLVYPVTFLAMSVWYGAASSRTTPRVDAAMTSEVIVTCGIASLILHVAVAGTYIDRELAGGTGFSEQTIRVVAKIFAEGLICAAFAPMIAVVVRFLEGSEQDTPPKIDEPQDAGAILAEFAQRAARLAKNMEKLSAAIDSSASRYESAAVRVTASLDNLAGDIEVKGKAVADQLASLEANTRSLGATASQTSGELRKVAAEAAGAFDAVGNGVRALGAEIDDFAGKVRTGGSLLEGLQTLIGSVNRFIRPGLEEPPPSKPS